MFGTPMTYRVPSNRLTIILCGLLLTTLAACSSDGKSAANMLLPTEGKTTTSPCVTFDECTEIFNKIVPYKTSVDNLDDLGLNPVTTANMKLLNYLDISERFNYSVEHKDAFPQGVRECLEVMSSCRGYDLIISRSQEERTGNAFLDLLHFKRKTETTGWIFKSLLVVKDNLIVYKLMGGTPKMDETNTKTKPLGLLQDSIGSLVPFK